MGTKTIQGKITWLILVLILLSGISAWSTSQPERGEPGLTQSPNAGLKHWMILILKPKNIVYQYYPYTGKLVKRIMAADHFDCRSADAVLKVILCNDLMINYDTGKIIVKNIPYIGPISPDGRYIIASGGTAIYDIKNRKTISFYPKGPDDKLYTEGGVPYAKNILVGRKNVPYHQLSDTDYLTFMHPTTPKPNGQFLAFRLSSPGGNRYTKYIYEYNLYDIIKKNSFGFSAKKRPEFGQELPIRWIENHVGKSYFLRSKVFSNSRETAWIKKRDKIGPQIGALLGITSNDGHWAIIYPKDKKGKYRTAIYNVKQRRIEINNLNRQFGVPNEPGGIYWVWIGDPKKHPGFVGY